jgi:glyoxylase-like metal-dependent hydrolase (beta-lactamase superfamily II)
VADSADLYPGITAVDTRMAGRAMVTSAYLIAGERPTLIETGPTTSVQAVLAALAGLGLGAADLAHIVVTHIHLDHAGGVGRLATHFPGATVWAHERGVPHLADPTRLVRSAARVYGEDRLQRLFGPVDPTAPDRLRALGDGDSLSLGTRKLEVLHTPGHASHHVCLVDSETGALFTGDALGIHLPDVGVLRPATPPPEVDVEQSLESIGRIRSRARSVLMFSHYGPVSEVEELCDIAARRLRRWAGIVREAMSETSDVDRVAEILAARTADELAPVRDRSGIDRYDLLADMRINAAGLVRYWQKRDERPASGPEPVPAPGL